MSGLSLLASSASSPPRSRLPVGTASVRSAMVLALSAAAFSSLCQAQAAALDPSFGDHGVVVTDLLGRGGFTNLHPARNPLTGKIAVVGRVRGEELHEQWTVLVFSSDGTPDTSFGQGGVVRTDFQPFGADSDAPRAAAWDTSGPVAGHRLLVAGQAMVPNVGNIATPRLAVVAYLADGSLDASFAAGGVMLLGGVATAAATTVAATPDGKLLVAGTRDADAVVLRLLHDGSLDASYGSGGIKALPLADMSLVAAAVQPDGGVVLGRQGFFFDPLFAPTASLTRIAPTGQIDAAFGVGGTVTLAGETLGSLAARADGTLVGLQVANGFGEPNRLRLYAADGATVGTDTPLSNLFFPNSLATGSDGSIVLGGMLSPNLSTFAVAKATASALLDTAFDVDGYAVLDLGGFQTGASAVPLPDGKVAVVGNRFGPPTFTATFVLARMLASGAVDTAFAGGTGFGVVQSEASTSDVGQDIAVYQADGKLVVLARGGRTGNAVMRYLPGGSLDPGFGIQGVAELAAAQMTGMEGTGIGLQSSGRIIVSGTRSTFDPITFASAVEMVTVGLDAQGHLDPTFAGDGIAAVALPDTFFSFRGGIALQADDKVVVCTTAFGFTGPVGAVARFLANGGVDTGFGTGGVVTVSSAGNSVTATAVAVGADGRIAVTGIVETPFPTPAVRVALAWLGANGSLLSGPGTTVPGFGADVAIDGSGRAVVAAQHYFGNAIFDEFGNFLGIGGASPWAPAQVAAIRVLPSGALDTSFGSAGVSATSVPTADQVATNTLAIQPDGRIVLAGAVTLQPTPGTFVHDMLVVRLLATGAPDPTFDDDGVTNVDVGDFVSAFSVQLQGDGKIVLVGTAAAFPTGPGFGQKNDVVLVRLGGVNSPDAMVAALQEVVRSMAEQHLLIQGRARSLQAKLQAALNQIDRNQLSAAVNQLLAFRNEAVAFHNANILNAADATFLIASAEAIVLLLGGTP